MNRDMVKFDLNLLLAFQALITERGVTKASRILGITQAAMSNTLRRLREVFDDPLFVKVGQRMEPTARALEIAGPVEAALRQVQIVLDQEPFDPKSSVHTFRLGMVDYSAAGLLPGLLEHLRTTAPGVTLEVVDVGGESEVTALEGGSVDLVFSRFQWVPSKVLLHRFFQWEYVCVFRPGHPLAKPGEPLTLEQFLAARHIHYYPSGMVNTVVDEALTQMGHSRNIVGRLSAFGMVPFLLATQDLMAVIPSGTADYFAPLMGLRVEPVPFKTPKLRVAMGWHPRTEHSPPNIWLREQVKLLLGNHDKEQL